MLIKKGGKIGSSLSTLLKDRKGTHRSTNSEVFVYLSLPSTGREKYLKVTKTVIINHSQVRIPDCER